MAKPTGWTRDQLLIALRLYMRMPFGKLHRGNPEIIALAKVIGRTPSALGMKACNFAALDPDLDRKGLSSVSQADRLIWNEFIANPEALVAEEEAAYDRLTQHIPTATENDIVIPVGETEVARVVRTRRVQSFFRDAVLVSYNHRCAVTGLALPELLVASHIIPWSKSIERRADPTNGLCLNVLFDRAFDRGLITLDEKMSVVISKRLHKVVSSIELQCSLLESEGRKIVLPERFQPDPTALAYHRQNVFA